MRSVWVEKRVLMGARRGSARVLEVGAMFGLSGGAPAPRKDEGRELAVVRGCEIPLPAGGVVFVTGPSGGGKSTILRLIGEGCRVRGDAVIEVGGLRAGDPGLPRLGSAGCGGGSRMGSSDPAFCGAVVDAVGGSLEEAMGYLSVVGLADAFVMMRRPEELSDGQRYRLSVAKAIEEAERVVAGAAEQTGLKPVCRDAGGVILLADEFGATLDRVSAKAMARNVRRWVRKSGARVCVPAPGKAREAASGGGSSTNSDRAGVTLVCATTHDDLLEALAPEVLVWKGLGEEIEVVER